MKIRPQKSHVIKVITDSAPEYVELFNEFHIYDGGWLVWPEFLIKIKNNLKLDNYVLLYEDERRINACFALFYYSLDELKKQKLEEASKNLEQQQLELDDLVQGIILFSSDFVEELFEGWPPTPEQEIKAKDQFNSLAKDYQKYLTEKYQYLFLSILSSLHNYFSVMICGEKLTSLVPKAMQGDDESFLKAVKIDRNLLISHPYFTERYRKAQLSGEKDFLQKVSARQSTPNLISKIRYPGLYIVFSMLDVMGWLDDLSHEEILDICDAAKLDRWQNRIEDVNSVTKQLGRYRRYQKTGGVSMH